MKAGTGCFDTPPNLQRGMLKLDRLQCENGKRILLRGGRQRFCAGGFIVPMHAPYAEDPGQSPRFC